MASATMKQQQLPYATAAAAAPTEDDDHSSSSSAAASAAVAAAAAATLSANFNHHQLLMSYHNRHSDYYQQHNHNSASTHTQMDERAHQRQQHALADAAGAAANQQHQHQFYQHYTAPSGFDPTASYHTSYGPQYQDCSYDTQASQQYSQQQVYQQATAFNHLAASTNNCSHFDEQHQQYGHLAAAAHEQQVGYNTQERYCGSSSSLGGALDESGAQEKLAYETRNCNHSTGTVAELDGRSGNKSNDSDADDKKVNTKCREVRKKSSKKSKKKRKTTGSATRDKDKRSPSTQTEPIKRNSEYNLIDTQSLEPEPSTVYLGEAQNYWPPQQSTSSNPASAQTVSHYADRPGGGFSANHQEFENDQYRLSAGIACNPTAAPNSASTCSSASPALLAATSAGSGTPASSEYNQLRILEMRKEKSRDAARSRRSKENHEFYELAKLLPLPAAITSQLDFLDKASIIRLTISFLKLRQFSVNGHPPWAPDFTTLGSVNPYTSSQTTLAGSGEQSQSCTGDEIHSASTTTPVELNDQRKSLSVSSTPGNSLTPSNVAFHPPPAPPAPASLIAPADTYHSGGTSGSTNSIEQLTSVRSFLKTNTASLFDVHQGTHILQSLDGFAFAIGRDGRFLYISETVSMYLGLSQVEMTGSSVFDYTHQQDHAELARQLGIPYYGPTSGGGGSTRRHRADSCSPRPPGSVQSQYSAASNETSIEDHMTHSAAAVARKRMKTATGGRAGRPTVALAAPTKKATTKKTIIKSERQVLVATDGQVNDDTNNNRNRVSKQDPDSMDAPVTSKPTNGFVVAADLADNAEPSPLPPRTIEGDPLVRQFCIRMKSTLTKRGCQHFKSSGYRVVHVVAHLRSYQSNDHGHLMDPLDDPQKSSGLNGSEPTSGATNNNATSATTAKSGKQGKRRGAKGQKNANSSESKLTEVTSDDPKEATCDNDNKTGGKLKIIGMVAVAIALPPPSINELRLESDTFVLRLGLDLKITHVEPKITELLQYPMELLAGRSLYSFIHPADLEQARTCHRDLLQKGQMMSGYYRLLARTGGYIWIQTCATLICNSTTAPMLGSSTLGPPSSISSPSPHLAQQQHQLMMSDNEPPAMMSGRGPGHYFPQTSTPTPISATSFESQLAMEQQQPHQFQSQQPPQQQQEQCVIFVNYMITNVIETQEILDVCQSKDFMPIQLANFSGLSQTVGGGSGNHLKSNHSNHSNSKHDNETTNDYVSPGSSCSSPCPAGAGNLRAAAGVKSGNGSAYLPASRTPNIINLSSSSSSSSSQQQTGRHWRNDQQASTGSRHTSGGTSSTSKSSRRQAAKVSRAHEQSQVYSSSSHASGLASESGFSGGESSPVGAVSSYAAAAAAAAAAAVAAASASTYDTAAARAFQPSAYATSAADDHCGRGGGGLVASSWHQQQQQQQQQQQHHQQQAYQVMAASHHAAPAIYADATGASNNHQQVAAQAADHYLASMDRTSIYKAATFAAAGLAASASSYAAYPSVAATYHHHHQHQLPLGQQLAEQHEHQHQQYHNHNHHAQQQYQQSQHVAAASSQQHYQTAAAAAAATVYSAHQHHPPWF